MAPSPYGDQYLIPPEEIDTAQAITDVVLVNRPLSVEKLAGSFMEALETRDGALMARLDEVEGLAREASSLPVSALRDDIGLLREDVSLLRETIESQQRSWWNRRKPKTGKVSELDESPGLPDNSKKEDRDS